MYEYMAEVLSVYDGDTIRLRVDLGMDTFVNKSVRLHGIDTPEITGEERPEGLSAKEFVTNWISIHAPKGRVRIETFKDRTEKYGRYLAVVYAPSLSRCLNDDLVAAGHAVAYDGGAR